MVGSALGGEGTGPGGLEAGSCLGGAGAFGSCLGGGAGAAAANGVGGNEPRLKVAARAKVLLAPLEDADPLKTCRFLASPTRYQPTAGDDKTASSKEGRRA